MATPNAVQEQLTELRELLEQMRSDCAETSLREEERAEDKSRLRGEKEARYDDLRNQLAKLQAEGDQARAREAGTTAGTEIRLHRHMI